MDNANNAEAAPEVSQKPSPRHLFVFWDRHELTVLIPAILSSAIIAGAKVAFAVVIGFIFQEVAKLGSQAVSTDEALAQISRLCVVLTALGVSKALGSAVFMTLWITHGERRAKAARTRLFRCLLLKKLAWFESRENGTAGLTTQLQTQLRELQLATAQLLGHIFCDFFVCAGCLGVAFTKSWELTLCLLASVPPSILILHLLGRRLESATEKQRQALNQAARIATASLVAIDVVKAYNNQDNALWDYVQRLRAAAKQYLVQAFGACSQMGFVKFWMVVLFVVGFWFGIFLVDLGRTTPGNVITAFYAVLIAFQSVESLGMQWLTIVKGMVAGSSMLTLTSAPDNDHEQEESGQTVPNRIPEDIELDNVSFAYPSNPDKMVLANANLFFPGREITFIVGKSGSGKSTVADLLVRFYEPSAGKILLDNHPIGDLDTKWLRQNITLVQQASALFPGTFHINVALGGENPRLVTKEVVRAACETAVLQRTIAGLPDGLETVVGLGGHELSGGQRQRLAFARAKLRDPPIMILDEITSGLDPVSARMLLDAIRVWRKNKTTIIITHDPFQIKDEDYVQVMDNGRTIQQGYFEAVVNEEDSALCSMLKANRSERKSPVAKDPPTAFQYLNEEPDDRSFMEKFLSPRVDGQTAGQGLFKRMSLLAPISRGQPAPATRSVIYPDVTSMLSRKSSLELIQDRGRKAQRQRHRFSTEIQARTAPRIATVRPVSNEADDSNSVSLWSVFKTVWSSLDRAHKTCLCFGLLACLIVAAGSPAFSSLFARMLQSFWAQNNKESSGRIWAILLLVVGCIDGMAVFLAFYMMDKVGQSWVNGLRVEAFKRVMRQPKSWFDEPKHAPNRIVECFDRNAEEMRKLVGTFVPIIVIATGMVLSSIIWAMVISWNLTVVALASGPVILGLTQLASTVSDRWEAACNQAAELTGSVFSQVFTSIRIVRALTQENYFTEEFEKSVDQTFRLGIGRAWRTGLVYGVNQGISDWITALVFYYGVKLLTWPDVHLTVDNVLQVVNLLLFSIGTATVMLGNIPQISSAKTMAAQMLHYANLPLRSSPEHQGGARVPDLLPIVTSKLRFAYPNQPAAMVLRNLSLNINDREFIAIAGASGSGKSTILSILLRLYDPEPETPPASWGVLSTTRRRRQSADYPYPNVTQPSLTYYNVASTALDTIALRHRMAYAPQTPYMFPGTIYDNIVFGLHDDSPYRAQHLVEGAAETALINVFINSLSEGYSTIVGDGGLQLSGGQAQRICIARAFLRNASLIVMDEPTSALDARTAELMRVAILGQVGRLQRSIIVVTHSKEMMRLADRVIFVQDGAVSGTGPYEELWEENDAFAELVDDVV